MKTKLISKIASLIDARENCKKDNPIWFEKHSDYLNEISKKYLPSGSGIDSGCNIEPELSNKNRIIITFGYHFMDENGYYDGWEHYRLICKPTFNGIDMKIVGKNKNGIKDYLYDTFDYCLNEVIEFNPAS